jgi:hypothetical protein
VLLISVVFGPNPSFKKKELQVLNITDNEVANSAAARHYMMTRGRRRRRAPLVLLLS